MGAQPGEPGAKPTEKLQKVTISKGFYMGIHEVTQDQYFRVMGKNSSVFQGEMPLKNKKLVETMEPGVVGHNHPVDHVTWDDAVEFCKRLTEMPEEKASSHVYRLPTEAEWEYACRAGTTSAYSLGDSKDSLDQAGWYGYNAGSEPIDSSKLFVESEGKLKKYVDDLIANRNMPQPVGRKKPNAWGLYDLHGNLWEWCSHWHGDYIDRYIQRPNATVVTLVCCFVAQDVCHIPLYDCCDECITMPDFRIELRETVEHSGQKVVLERLSVLLGEPSAPHQLADFAFDDSSDEPVLARISLAWICGLRQAQVGGGERSGFLRKATILHESIP